MTPRAYTLIMTPVAASVRPKEEPMSVSRPIGMNSEVLKMKAENVSPMSGSHP